MKTTFLKPKQNKAPTKTFKFEDGAWKMTESYQAGKYFYAIEQEFDDLKDFSEILCEVSAKKVFMINGEIIDDPSIDRTNMVRRSRATEDEPATIKDTNMPILSIDVDDYPLLYSDAIKTGEDYVRAGLETIKQFIAENLPVAFANADYAYQFSSSFGLTSKKLKCHLFFQPDYPIRTKVMMNWAKSWNKKSGSNVLDPAIYKPTQPIYTMIRQIEGDEIDPICDEDMIGYVDNGNMILNWAPTGVDEMLPESKTGVTRTVTTDINKSPDFDIEQSIKGILTAENYHDNIRSTALSLINKGVSRSDTQTFIEQFLDVSKQSLAGDPERLEALRQRRDDVPRAVESALTVAKTIDFDDTLRWVKSNPLDLHQRFGKRLMSFSGVDLRVLTTEVDKTTGYGMRAVNDTIKSAKAEHQKEISDLARKIKSKERASQNIYEIEITTSNHGTVTESICKILANSKKEPRVFRLGSSLSYVTNGIPKTVKQVLDKTEMKHDYPKTPMVASIATPIGLLRTRLERDIVFVNNKGEGVLCPDSILNSIPAMYDAPWKPLTGLLNCPYVDDQWNLIDKQGYQEDTGLFSVLHAKLRIKPMDPAKAYDYLANDLLSEFPFNKPLDCACAIAMLMTAVQKPRISGDNGLPGFAIISPKPSSGKTTLAQLLSYSIFNKPIPVTSYTDCEDEMGKLLLSIFKEGHNVVLFDNIPKGSSMKSNELARAITSPTYSRRTLGSNNVEEVSSSMIWLATGNGITLTGDYSTRFLPINLLPKTATPQDRKFKRENVGEYAVQNRKRILSAVISIIMAGKNQTGKESNSSSRFKEWDRFVRTPLLMASGIDVLDAFKENSFVDEESVSKGQLFEFLYEVFKDKSFKSKDLIDMCSGMSIEGTGFSIDSNGSQIKDLIENAFTEKAVYSTRTLGRYLLSNRDLIENGYKLVKLKGHDVSKWGIVPVDYDTED